jgi:hypothetical protein
MQHKHKNVDTIRRGCRTRDMNQITPACLTRNESEGPLHTRDWETVTITLQALSLVGKVEPVQVHFTLCSRDQRSMWMQHEHKVYMDSYMASNGSYFHGHLDYFQKPPLGGRPSTKPGNHGTPNAHNRWFILFYHTCIPAWIEIHWNNIWLRARSHMTSHYTRGSWPHYMTLEVCCIALHWVPIPMPMGFGWAWVRYYCSCVGMGGHWFCASILASKSESNFSDAGNTLNKKRYGLKPMIVNDFLFVRSNQDLV